MSHKVVVIEADEATRAVWSVALAQRGHPAQAVGSLDAARALLDRGEVAVALIDEGLGQPLAEASLLRELYPTVVVVVTGTLLPSVVLMQMLRLGFAGALRKPCTPDELDDLVTLALARARPSYLSSLEFAAALRMARACLLAGQPAEALAALGRARALAGFDAEVMLLSALAAELLGHDRDAAAGYRAALALGQHEDDTGAMARAGLARLEAYGPARPVGALDPLHVASLARRGSASGLVSPAGEASTVTLHALGLAEQPGAVYLRQDAHRAFVLATGRLDPSTLTTGLGLASLPGHAGEEP